MTNSQAVATRYLSRPEGRIAYDVTGNGPLVIAVPGMGDLRSTFRDLVPALVEAGFRVATADVRGHGDSDTTFRTHGDAATADDMLALIRELGGPALIVGNSFAGSAAVIAAGTEPALVAGTALISPFLREPGPAGLARTAVHLLYGAMFARPWGAGAWTGYFAKTLNRGARAPWFDEHVAAIRSSLGHADRLRSFRRLALQLDHSIVEPFVDAAATVPHLTIVGAIDPDYRDPAAELEYMGRRLGGETLLVPDAAHYAHTQQAATVIPAIVAFAEGLRTADGADWASVPRAGLSRAAVVDLAVQLVDDDPEGLAALTLAAVAQKAGVAVPSLYKHVGSLAELRSAVTEVGLRELTRRTATAAIGVAGEEALFALGHAIRSFAHDHPGLYAASQVAPRTDAELMRVGADAAEVVAAVLRGFGLPPEREVDAVRATRAALHGFVALEAGGGFGLPDDVDRSFGALLGVLAGGIGRMAAR